MVGLRLTMALTPYQYEANEYQPTFDSLPFEADYRAAEKKAQDNERPPR
jgi:hypothetical protein